MKNHIFLWLCFFTASVSGFTQSSTYALIIGVSRYEHANIKPLKYADDDALAFKNVLLSKSGGNVPAENIKCFINEEATSSKIIGSYSWVENVPKSGDKMIIYFSGHGDAIDPELVYLLTYDANASDPNNYENTSLSMWRIKNMIKKLKIKGVEVLFITDACRTNEISGTGGTGIYSFESIMNKDYGEIKMNSCSANQKSLEDVRWGNGHGVFTYYLLQGWMGMANENEDEEITAGELFRYITVKVKNATYDNALKKTLQVPSSCCAIHEDFVISAIDKETLRKLKDVEDQVVVPDDIFAYATSKSVVLNYEEDSITMGLYRKLLKAIEEDKLLPSEAEGSAVYYYEQLKTRAAGRPVFYDGESELVGALTNKAQGVFTLFLNGNTSHYNSSVFHRAFLYMSKVLELVPADDYYYPIYKAKSLFLESQTLLFTVSNREKALLKIDSAIALQPNTSYVYYTKGLIYEKYLMYDSAITYYDKSISLAPKWYAPYKQKSGLLNDMGKKSLALVTMQQLLQQSDKALNLVVMGDFYYGIDSTGSAIRYYEKAIAKDSTLIDAYLGLYICNKYVMNTAKADMYFNKALAIDSAYEKIYAMYAAYYETKEDYTRAKDYYAYLYNQNPDNLYYYSRYAEVMFKEGATEKAAQAYDDILAIDPFYLPTYYSIINILEYLGAYESSISYNKMLMEYDPGYNPANLYYPYNKLGKTDSAAYYLDMAIRKFPEDDLTLLYEAYDLMEKEDYQAAINVYEKFVAKNTTSSNVYHNLALCYGRTGDLENCMKYGKKAVDIEPFNPLYNEQMVLYMLDASVPYDSINRFVHTAIDRHLVNTEKFLLLAAENYLYLNYNEDLMKVCEQGIELYPNSYKFYLLKSIAYNRAGDNKSFYATLETAFNKGMYCEVMDQYAGYLPGLATDKKYLKMSKKFCAP